MIIIYYHAEDSIYWIQKSKTTLRYVKIINFIQKNYLLQYYNILIKLKYQFKSFSFK